MLATQRMPILNQFCEKNLLRAQNVAIQAKRKRHYF